MRYVGNEVGLQSRQRYFLGNAAISQEQPADQQHGKNPEDEKTALNPGLVERLRARTLELDTQGQSTQLIQVARDLGLPFSPSSRSGEQLVPVPALVLRGINRHSKLISAFLSQLLGYQLLEHCREKGLLQVIRLEVDPTHHYSVLGELR